MPNIDGVLKQKVNKSNFTNCFRYSQPIQQSGLMFTGAGESNFVKKKKINLQQKKKIIKNWLFLSVF